MTGTELITAERERQVSVEGWTPEHDDAHSDAQLGSAGIAYAVEALRQIQKDPLTRLFQGLLDIFWPEGWYGWWRPSPNPIRNLVKAGALLSAEIDRLQRLGGK